MNSKSPTIELMDPQMVESLRRKTPAERLAQGFGMWDFAIGMMHAVIRREHPEWLGADVEREIRRRIRGRSSP